MTIELEELSAWPPDAYAWPRSVCRAFQIIVCDWDGTAVEDRAQDASEVAARIKKLLRLGIRFVIVTGTHFENVNRQLSAPLRDAHKDQLYVCTNRGSETWTWRGGRPVRIFYRSATEAEELALTRAAEDVQAWLGQSFQLRVEVVYDRLNRRKIDLIPLPEWVDPPKSRIGALRAATEERLTKAGIHGGLAEVLEYARGAALRAGLPDPRLTSDAKHIEIGLTDKSDAMEWVIRELARPRGIKPAEILVIGDEFGEVAASPGSDSLLMTESAAGATFGSVGPEPYGVPRGIVHLPGGPMRFLALLDLQVALWTSARFTR
jgi:hydroxymethylpyrimidine pyrophosphatase-like HAD family hydrolase